MSASIENFYWILYENLLKPSGMDCRYQWPFNSGNVVRWPFEGEQVLDRPLYEKHDNPKNCHLTFFHFDQEPIYEKDGSIIDDGTFANNHKNLRLLANSEISNLKKEFCQRYDIGDWYYFYHGFAALDWYRDAEYINIDRGITCAFSSFNHIIRNERSYRMSLTARFAEKGILDRGMISFHGNASDCVNEIQDPYTRVSNKSKQLIERYLIQDNIQPMIVDSRCVDGSYSAKFGGNMYRMRQKSFLQIVNETIFYDQKLHLTEKSFHPIVHLRPFMLVAAPGNLEYLKSYGFETFSKWIDESYDTIDDDDQRLDHIAAETDRISKKSIPELEKMLKEMHPILEFNKQHFFGRFREIIASELVDNFETCVRIWNNGRVDDYSVYMPMSEELNLVKRLLSQ